MALPLLAAPVLGRLYIPADYGPVALYMAVVNVLSVVSALQFQQGIITERSDRAARELARLCLMLGGCAALLVGLAVGVLWQPLLERTVAGRWMLLLPLSTALTGLVAGTTFLANRHRRYGWLARIQILQVSVTLGLSVLLGALGWGPKGPVIAYLAGQGAQAAAHVRVFMHLAGKPSLFGVRRLRALARKHRNFATFTTPDQFLVTLGLQLPVFSLGAMGAAHALGAFTRAQQLVSVPIALLGTAVAKVFQQEAAERYRATHNCRPLLLRTAGSLFVGGLPVCLVLFWSAPWLFEIVLGPAWREAGVLARILAPMLLLRLVVSSVAGVFMIAQRQRESFVLSSATLVIVGLSAVSSSLIHQNPREVIYVISVSFSIMYVIYLIVLYRISARRSAGGEREPGMGGAGQADGSSPPGA